MNNQFKNFENEEQFILEGTIINYGYRPELANVFAHIELHNRGNTSTHCLTYLNKFAKEKI